MAEAIDIVATWPKTRPLESYLEELAKAEGDNLEINYRVSKRPSWKFGTLRDRHARCYMVHDGHVHGYNDIKYVIYRNENEVSRVANDAWAGFWPKGIYIVRNPTWHPITLIPMKGFQGWRWFKE